MIDGIKDHFISMITTELR